MAIAETPQGRGVTLLGRWLKVLLLIFRAGIMLACTVVVLGAATIHSPIYRMVTTRVRFSRCSAPRIRPVGREMAIRTSLIS
ncbi:MAG: hypothetical protein RR689_04655 [Mucinivorans sp.]